MSQLMVPRIFRAAATLLFSTAAGTPFLPGVARPALAQEDGALGTMEDAARRYREVRAMCADFEQVIEVRLMGRTVESAGRICQQRPNLFSMRFTEPQGDLVVSDGRHFWVYYPSMDDKQVVRHPVADSPGRHDFFREFLEDPAAKYAASDGGTEAVAGHECRVVSLTPTAAASYRRARLWVDAESHLVRQLELHEESGNIRTVILHNEDLAPALDPALFTFQPPPGARVLGPPGSPGARTNP
ncbi:MAG: outer membrane lipoprotein carrier protein LolA [Gemmatimonadota bacterium]|nr:outer membrane lipoprotein carrier protein LolA [Gemmatimonadota bacterium]